MNTNPRMTDHIDGVSLTDLKSWKDDRGEFMEFFRVSNHPEISNIVQINKSISVYGVLRGLHIAHFPKVIHVVKGTVQQIVLDCRTVSPTFGKFISMELCARRPQTLVIPAGCGNGFCVLNPQGATYVYGFTSEWTPGCEQEVNPLDTDLSIPWRIKDPILSERDKQAQNFYEVFELQINPT